MTPQVYQRAAEIYQQARNLSGDARDACIEAACGNDREIQRLVRSMLLADQAAPSFLDPRDSNLGQFAMEAIRERDAIDLPDRIASYRILSRLGAGGMGVVYEAQQDNPRRRVALKVVRPGLLAPAIIARFDREVEIAGRLHHPGIAHILEAGTFRQGHGEVSPFFSMEFIQGPRIDVHCRDAALDARARIGLFVKVCDAVAYAHANGVVHRDLKPGNILVDLTDPSGPMPKVLDFGVARLSDGTAAPLATETGQVIGTLAYMSPEQVSGRSVDPRSDLYSLGVVLYELLADRSPYSQVPASVAEAVRIVCDTDATRLGIAVPALRGDLETILGKTLERDPLRRYNSVTELAMDLTRFLRDEPIAARPPSTWYHVRKFVKRNRVLVSAVAAAFVALAAGLAVSTALWFNAAVARDHASQEAARLRVVRDFVRKDFMGAASPDLLGPNATVLDAIDRAAASIDSRFATEPEYAGMLHLEVGAAYSELAQDDKAIPHIDRAIELLTVCLGPEAEAVLDAMSAKAELLAAAGELDAAETLLRTLLQTTQRVYGPGAEIPCSIQSQLGSVLHMKGNYEESERLLRDAADRQLRASGRDYLRRYLTLNQLGAALAAQGRFEEAYTVNLEVQEAHDRLKPNHPDTVATLNELAVCCLKLGKVTEHDEYLLRAVNLANRVMPNNSVHRAMVLGSYGTTLLRERRHDEAEPYLIEALRILRAVLGSDNYQSLLALERVAGAHAAQGRMDQLQTDLGEIPPNTDAIMNIRIRSRVSGMLYQSKNYDEAIRHLAEARSIAAEAFGEISPAVANCEIEQADCFLRLLRTDDATKSLNAALEHAGEDQTLKAKIRERMERLADPQSQSGT